MAPSDKRRYMQLVGKFWWFTARFTYFCAREMFVGESSKVLKLVCLYSYCHKAVFVDGTIACNIKVCKLFPNLNVLCMRSEYTFILPAQSAIFFNYDISCIALTKAKLPRSQARYILCASHCFCRENRLYLEACKKCIIRIR